MKVLLVNKFHYRKGGGETYYFDLAEGLRSLGHEVIFFSSQSERNEPCAQGCYFTRERNYDGGGSPLAKARDGLAAIYSFDAKRCFNRLLMDEKPDIVHLNLVQRQLTFSIMDAPALKGIPVVYTAHDYGLVCPNYLMLDGSGEICDACVGGDYLNCVRRRCIRGSYAKSTLASLESFVAKSRGCYKRIDTVIAPSRFMADKLAEGGVPAEKINVLHNFANPALLEHAREPRGKDNSLDRYFLFFGRLSREKGVKVLIDAYASIRDSIPRGMRLVIVGDGPERRSLESLVSDLNLSDHVVFAGYQTGEALTRYIESASFVVVSSQCRENYPYSIVEAFACGTPVVGTRMGGIPELVTEGETGYLCESGSSASLGESMVRAASTPADAYKAMQGRCRRYVLEECTKERYLRSLMSVYELAAQHRRGC
jgi:glycosyltransferase involved in cell wall biosynthesis